MFDGGGLDGSLDCSMEVDLERADLREADTVILRETVATLRIGETVVAVPALKPGITWLLTVGNSAEEVIKGFLQP